MVLDVCSQGESDAGSISVLGGMATTMYTAADDAPQHPLASEYHIDLAGTDYPDTVALPDAADPLEPNAASTCIDLLSQVGQLNA
jgi:hypothetical protein